MSRRRLPVFFHNSVNFTRKPLSTTSKNYHHLEEMTISIAMDNRELLITNVYTPARSCNGCYSPPLGHMLTGTDSLVLGDFNAHHSPWHSGTTDTRGNQLADAISISSFAFLNADSPTRRPGNSDPSYPELSLASASLITSSEWQTHTTMSSDHLPILIRRKVYTQQVPAEILAMMEERDEIRKQEPPPPPMTRLSTMNDEMTKAISDHK